MFSTTQLTEIPRWVRQSCKVRGSVIRLSWCLRYRHQPTQPGAFKEVLNMSLNKSSHSGWLLAGIQAT